MDSKAWYNLAYVVSVHWYKINLNYWSKWPDFENFSKLNLYVKTYIKDMCTFAMGQIRKPRSSSARMQLKAEILALS